MTREVATSVTMSRNFTPVFWGNNHERGDGEEGNGKSSGEGVSSSTAIVLTLTVSLEGHRENKVHGITYRCPHLPTAALSLLLSHTHLPCLRFLRPTTPYELTDLLDGVWQAAPQHLEEALHLEGRALSGRRGQPQGPEVVEIRVSAAPSAKDQNDCANFDAMVVATWGRHLEAFATAGCGDSGSRVGVCGRYSSCGGRIERSAEQIKKLQHTITWDTHESTGAPTQSDHA